MIYHIFSILRVNSTAISKWRRRTRYVTSKRMRDGSIKNYVCKRDSFPRKVNLSFSTEDDMTLFRQLDARGERPAQRRPPFCIISIAEALIVHCLWPGGNKQYVKCGRGAWQEMCPVLHNVTLWRFASSFRCKCEKNHSMVLQSSTNAKSVRVVDCLFVTAFLCNGILATQFKMFCKFACLYYSPPSLERGYSR